MANKKSDIFRPDYAIPPGETLLETLGALNMTRKELAIRIDLSEKHIVDIIKGKGPITPETALKFEKALGVPAGFWNNLERNYRDTLARLSEERRLKKDVDWLNEIPVNALADRGWIKKHNEKVKTLQEVLSYFGVSSPNEWRDLWRGVRFAARRSAAFEADPGAVAAWMRMGELVAQKIECESYDKRRFLESLKEIRDLTIETVQEFRPKVVQLCANAGVAVVFVEELPGIRLSGITRWLGVRKALIQLSLRYKTNDQLWFTFSHEAGHILKHGKKDMFLELDEDDNQNLEKEKEANDFAKNFLIPPRAWSRFTSRKTFYSKRDIKDFAKEVGISPGIVVGRLQHEKKMHYSNCNDLKVKLDWGS